MYAKVQNGEVVAYPYGPSELMRDNPGVSFPSPMSDTVLERYGIVPVQPCNPPDHDYLTQNCFRTEPKLVEDVWTESWEVVTASQEESQQRFSELEDSIRNQRNELLKDCDWTQLADAPVNALAWANYRQNLRDITAQTGFPRNVDWPKKPE